MSFPWKNTLPESGGIRPAAILRSVLLPRPDGPMITVLLPREGTSGDLPQRVTAAEVRR